MTESGSTQTLDFVDFPKELEILIIRFKTFQENPLEISPVEFWRDVNKGGLSKFVSYAIRNPELKENDKKTMREIYGTVPGLMSEYEKKSKLSQPVMTEDAQLRIYYISAIEILKGTKPKKSGPAPAPAHTKSVNPQELATLLDNWFEATGVFQSFHHLLMDKFIIKAQSDPASAYEMLLSPVKEKADMFSRSCTNSLDNLEKLIPKNYWGEEWNDYEAKRKKLHEDVKVLQEALSTDKVKNLVGLEATFKFISEDLKHVRSKAILEICKILGSDKNG